VEVALAHDYLTQRGGAERVALALTDVFPGAPLYTSVYAPDQTFDGFAGVDVRTSWLQRVPLLRRDPRLALPLLPPAWEGLRPRGADVVVSSSSGWAHGIGPEPGCGRVVYCHNPARWLYQPDDYAGHRATGAALRLLGRGLSRWDRRAAASADHYFANSRSVRDRIRRVYGIDAEVLPPPVSVDPAGEQEPVEGLEPGFWLTVARGRGYKNVQAVIDGVGLLDDGQLALVGSPEPGQVSDDRNRWLGVVSDAQLRWLYAHARALVSVSYEDFGLTPLEANAFGTPAVVLRAGGFLDTLAEGVSGAFVEEPEPEAVASALRDLPDFDRAAVVAHASRFGFDAFAARMRQVATEVAART